MLRQPHLLLIVHVLLTKPGKLTWQHKNPEDQTVRRVLFTRKVDTQFKVWNEEDRVILAAILVYSRLLKVF